MQTVHLLYQIELAAHILIACLPKSQLNRDGRLDRDELRDFVHSFATAAREVTEGWVGQVCQMSNAPFQYFS